MIGGPMELIRQFWKSSLVMVFELVSPATRCNLQERSGGQGVAMNNGVKLVKVS